MTKEEMMNETYNQVLNDIKEYGDGYIDWNGPEQNIATKSMAYELGKRFEDEGYFVYCTEWGYGFKDGRTGTVSSIRVRKDVKYLGKFERDFCCFS